jgi:hypothetical protein
MTPSRPASRFVPALVLALSAASCGGGADDPCAVPTGAPPSTQSLASLDVHETKLVCHGSLDGVALDCAAPAVLTKTACGDGSGYTLSSGNVSLLIRLSKDDSWHVGMRLASGVSPEGDITIAGGFGEDPHPAAGAEQAGSFHLTAGQATIEGTFRTTW